MPTNLALLIVDDDLELAAMLGEFLTGEGFECHHAPTGAEAMRLIGQRAFRLLILDIMMPDVDGLELLRRLRAVGQIPVLMLTARGEDDDRILGLELGADDYLSKPFNPRELAARIRAVLRRPDRQSARSPFPIEAGPLTLHPAELSASMGGHPVRLTTAEFMVLETLARAPGHVHSRAALTQQALGRRLEPFDRSIDTHIANLRRKLGLASTTEVEIRSVRGAGYLLTIGQR